MFRKQKFPLKPNFSNHKWRITMRIKQNSISTIFQRLMTVMIAVLVTGLCGTAWGQQPTPTPPPTGDPFTTITISTTQKVVFNPPTTTTTNINRFSTQIIGRIGGGRPLFDQTFAFPFSHPTSQAGVTAARAAITTAGGPGVIIGSPVRTASSSTTTTTSATTYSLASTTQDEPETIITFGPERILTGQLTVCTGISSLPSSTAPTCGAGSPTPYNLPDGETNFNIIRGTTFNIDQLTTTTNTTTQFEQYTITGTVRRIGSVHALTTEAGGDATSLFADKLRKVGDGELKRGVWFNGYGWFGKRDSNGEIAGDNRHGKGISVGYANSLGKGFRGGVGFDKGTTKLTLDTVGESGTVDLTQFGAHLDYERGGLRLRFANANGWGNVTTQTAPSDLEFFTTANYNLTTTSLSGEASYAVSLSKWKVTPNAGIEWRRVKNDGFTETGIFGLTANAHTTTWNRGWAGTAVERTIGEGGLFKVYGRATFNGNDRVLLPVTFAILGGGMMNLESPDYGKIGSEAGASILFPVTKNAFLYAAYDARIRGNLMLNNVTGGFKLVF
jgi:hypothetical protein